MNRFATVAAVAVVMVVAVFVGLQLTQGGPLIGGDPSASPSATAEPSASDKPTPKPTPTEPATETPIETPGPEPDFVCGQPIHLDAVGSDFHPLVVADIRLGTHDGYDRIVFEYVLDGTPYLDIDEAQPPFVENPSGLPLEVAGSPGIPADVWGATKFDTETGEQPYQGRPTSSRDTRRSSQFVESGDFEATHSWFLGTNGGNCLRAFYLTDPSRTRDRRPALTRKDTGALMERQLFLAVGAAVVMVSRAVLRRQRVSPPPQPNPVRHGLGIGKREPVGGQHRAKATRPDIHMRRGPRGRRGRARPPHQRRGRHALMAMTGSSSPTRRTASPVTASNQPTHRSSRIPAACPWTLPVPRSS